jgi:hypothetical protein
VDSYSTLPWVTWEAVTGVESIPCCGLLWHTQANGALVYPSHGGRYRAEAAWHWGSDSIVVDDPLGEPGRTPFYVGLPSAWASVDDDYIFGPHFVGGLRFGDSDRYKK